MTLGQSSTPLENRSRAALLHKEGSPCRVTEVPFSPNGLGRGVRGGRRAKLGGGKAAPGPGREMINHGRLSADRPSPASPVTQPAQRGKDKATEQGTLPASSPPPRPRAGASVCLLYYAKDGWQAGPPLPLGPCLEPQRSHPHHSPPQPGRLG